MNHPGLFSFVPESHRILHGSRKAKTCIQFDLTNMFNAASRLSCKHNLDEDDEISDLVPIFDLCTTMQTSASIRNQMDHGTFLSRTKVSLRVSHEAFYDFKKLHPVLQVLNNRLMHRAAACKALGNCGDDGNGSEPAMGVVPGQGWCYDSLCWCWLCYPQFPVTWCPTWYPFECG